MPKTCRVSWQNKILVTWYILLVVCMKTTYTYLLLCSPHLNWGFRLITMGIYCQHQRVNDHWHYVLLRQVCMCVSIAIFLEVHIILGWHSLMPLKVYLNLMLKCKSASKHTACRVEYTEVRVAFLTLYERSTLSAVVLIVLCLSYTKVMGRLLSIWAIFNCSRDVLHHEFNKFCTYTSEIF